MDRLRSTAHAGSPRLKVFPEARPAERPRIAIVTTIADAQWQFMRGQNAFLIDAGFELHGIASPGPLLHELARRDGLTVHPVRMSREIRPLADLAALWRLVRVLRRVRPHILHVSTPKAALLAGLAGWWTRVPIRVFLVRGLICDGTSGARGRLLRLAEALTVRLCHRAYFTSHSLLEFAEENGIIGPGRGIVLQNGMSNGIDAEQFHPHRVTPAPLARSISLHGPAERPDGPVIGFVGRLGRDKGIDLLWHAWQRLRKEFPRARLLIVGGWERERPVAPAVREALERDPRVELTGRVEDVAPYYRAMSVFAFPSRREGFPNAPMEAAAMALPVVATRAVGTVDAVVDGVTGTLTPSGDADAFAGAIARYLREPELGRQHGNAGRQRVLRHFQPTPLWRALLAELRVLLRASGLPAPRPLRLESPPVRNVA